MSPPSLVIDSIIEMAYECGDVDGALDLMFELFNDAMRAGEWADIDAVLAEAIGRKHWTEDLLVGFLTATYPAGSFIRMRSAFEDFARACVVEESGAGAANGLMEQLG